LTLRLLRFILVGWKVSTMLVGIYIVITSCNLGFKYSRRRPDVIIRISLIHSAWPYYNTLTEGKESGIIDLNRADIDIVNSF